VARALSLIPHTNTVPSLQLIGTIHQIILSVSMVHIGTIMFYLYLLPMYLYHQRWVWSCRKLFIYYLFLSLSLSHTHYFNNVYYII
jgi:hypothetical protein